MPENNLECLQCGQSKAQVKAEQTICATEGGYEYLEITNEWPRHRWAPWSDAELTLHGIKAESYAKYRLWPLLEFEYIACQDRLRGHNPAKELIPDFGITAIGQCFDCYALPEQTASPS